MNTWKLWGELPSARSREEIRSQSLDGWKVWRHPWNRCNEPGIVVPDSEALGIFHHAPTFWVENEQHRMKFAVVYLDNGARRFFVPADSKDEGAFDARTPRYEGFWRSSLNAEESLPWPEPDSAWLDRAAFLQALRRVETTARKFVSAGFSLCRLCGTRNGNESFQADIWEWPEGFRHYVAEHQVRPTPDFESFVLGR